MNRKTKIYIACAAAALVAIGVLGGSAIEGRRVRGLERRIYQAERSASDASKAAEQREREAEQFRQKIAYLETQLAGSREVAAEQDEKLKLQNSITGSARDRVARTRGVSSGDASVAELCERLNALGHKCAD